MRHLVFSRELPPGSYPPGGIGTYVANMVRLLAEAGETVHVIGEQWKGAPLAREERCGGRLIVHRVPVDSPVTEGKRVAAALEIGILKHSGFPSQAWNWNAALLAETLVEEEGIDLIEAQEWEAPLYHFLVRRAAGLGPARRPPCLVHFHSPTELILHNNEWDVTENEFLQLIRQEQYCIAAADAHVCPSHYLARQVEGLYGLEPKSVQVIPYPFGDFTAAPRSPESWESGPILYFGRLEPRKGLVEYIDAAVRVASEFSGLRFLFVGADLPYRDGWWMKNYLISRIPSELASRFEFRDSVPRAELPEILARARAGAVPSRWENFPNTCIEAMRAGLPVVVSPTGGMVEMIEDGVSGWIAPSQQPGGLEVALRRAARATPAELARMGAAAAERIGRRCDNAATVALHLEFRARVAGSGSTRSSALPAVLPWAKAPMHGPHPTPRRATPNVRPGAGEPIVFAPGGTDRVTDAALALARTRPAAVGIVVVAAGCEADRSAVLEVARVLDTCPEIGLVAGWTSGRGILGAPPAPSFPYQWLKNEPGAVVVFRREALLEAGPVRPELHEPFALWDTVNAVLAAGWKGLTVPMILGHAHGELPIGIWDAQRLQRKEMHRLLRARFPKLIERDADDLLGFLIRPVPPSPTGVDDAAPATTGNGESVPGGDRWKNLSATAILKLPFREKLDLAGSAIRDPRRTIAWLRDHLGLG